MPHFFDAGFFAKDSNDLKAGHIEGLIDEIKHRENPSVEGKLGVKFGIACRARRVKKSWFMNPGKRSEFGKFIVLEEIEVSKVNKDFSDYLRPLQKVSAIFVETVLDKTASRVGTIEAIVAHYPVHSLRNGEFGFLDICWKVGMSRIRE